MMVYLIDLTTQTSAILQRTRSEFILITYFANATDYANKKKPLLPLANYVNTTLYQSQTIIAEVSQ
jgi:hypothetical protein